MVNIEHISSLRDSEETPGSSPVHQRDAKREMQNGNIPAAYVRSAIEEELH